MKIKRVKKGRAWVVTGDPLPPPSGPRWPDWLAHDDCTRAQRRALPADQFFGLNRCADWSPGRYALVLRDHSDDPFFGGVTGRPTPCRSFSGFAELSEVL